MGIENRDDRTVWEDTEPEAGVTSSGEAAFSSDKEQADDAAPFARAAIALLRGVVFRDKDEALWQTVWKERVRLMDYFRVIGLQLYVDEADEYAYLRQDESSGLPRIMPRHPLGFSLSMMLVTLRKKLGEFDAARGDARLIVTRDDLELSLRPYFPPVTNETQFLMRVDRDIQQAVQMGFLEPVGAEAAYAVRPLLRSFVTAEWLRDFEARLKEYEAYGQQDGGEEAVK